MKDQGWQGIVPATDWLAVFVRPDRTIYTERVALWVWKRDVDVDGSPYDCAEGVLGRTSMEEVEYADDSEYFVGYLHVTEDIEAYSSTIERVLERVEQKRKQREAQRDQNR